MTFPRFSRRDVLMKLGIFLNGLVAAVLAVPVVRYLLSPLLAAEKTAMNPGFRSAISINFLPERLAWRLIATLL